MRALLHIAEHLVLDRLIQSHTPLSAYDKVGTGFLILSGLLSILGVGLIVYASHIYFIKNFEPEIAFAFTGAVTLGMAAIFALAVLLHKVYKMKKITNLKNDIMDTIWDAVSTLEEEITEPVQEHPKTAVSLAAVAGYAASEFFLEGTKKSA